MPKMKFWNGSAWITLDANDADTLDGKHASYFDDKIGLLSGSSGLVEKANKSEFDAYLAENEQQFLDVNLNIIDIAVELETLKGATLNGVTANIFIETFQNLNDINLTHGVYDSTNKRVYL